MTKHCLALLHISHTITPRFHLFFVYLHHTVNKKHTTMTYEEAKEIALSMPEVTSMGAQYVEEFVQGFMEAMNSGDTDEPQGNA